MKHWKQNFKEEFGIHFIGSKGELRFALGFISALIERARAEEREKLINDDFVIAQKEEAREQERAKIIKEIEKNRLDNWGKPTEAKSAHNRALDDILKILKE